MTVYVDTSSLLKVFFTENGSEEVTTLLSGASVATSVVAYAEARAALARAHREKRLTRKLFGESKRAFEAFWSACAALTVTPDIARAAGHLAEQYRLRGFDSIHLASFVALAERRGLDEVVFSSFDAALNRAADAWRRQARRRKPAVRRARS